MEKYILEFISLFHASSKIPLSWYTLSGNCQISCPFPIGTQILPLQYCESITKNPEIFISLSHGFYGIVRLENHSGFIFMGPIYNIPVTPEIIHSFITENTVANNYHAEITTILQSIPRTSFSQFLNHLAFLYYGLTGSSMNISNYFKTIENKKEVTKQDFLNQFIENKESLNYHNTYLWEQKLYHLIKNGESAKLNAFLQNLSNISHLNEGIMAVSPLRQSKNLFIGTTTKVGMLAAIPGGLDIEQTYQLIDTYAQECEQMTSVSEVNHLSSRMIMDFCERMAKTQIPDGVSREVYFCMCYIRNHTNESISVTDVAAQIHRSNSYIINRFRQELEINIGAYIRRCKLEEAKSLLVYSTKSLSEISNYLCFSSQSYFQNIFKKKYGITPMQYRRQHHVDEYVNN